MSRWGFGATIWQRHCTNTTEEYTRIEQFKKIFIYTRRFARFKLLYSAYTCSFRLRNFGQGALLAGYLIYSILLTSIRYPAKPKPGVAVATVPVAIDILEPNSSSFNTTILEPSVLVAQWLECWTSHSKVAGSNPNDVRVMILRSPGVVSSEKLHLTLCIPEYKFPQLYIHCIKTQEVNLNHFNRNYVSPKA